MPRPRLHRHIEFQPNVTYFKPRGIPLRELEVVELSAEELEAYRLRHGLDLDQETAAQRMRISTSTYQRSLYAAYQKIAEALIHGKAIKLKKFND